MKYSWRLTQNINTYSFFHQLKWIKSYFIVELPLKLADAFEDSRASEDLMKESYISTGIREPAASDRIGEPDDSTDGPDSSAASERPC